MRVIMFSSLFLLVTAVWAQEGDMTPTEKIEELVVVGRQPGPPLWKVTHGDNELYIFGQLSPLPRDMIWEAPKVEAVIARSDEFLTQPGVSVGVGYNPIKMFRAIRTAIRVTKNADGKTLAEILPADLYRRFSALKEKYAPRDRNMEKLRPMIAGFTLMNAAIKDEGLVRNDRMMKKLYKLVKQNRRIETTETELEVKLSTSEFNDAAAAYENVSLQKEVTCLETTLTSLETDIAGMRSRANSWALGYVDELRQFDYPDPGKACGEVFMDMEMAQDLSKQVQEKWLAAAENALAGNRTSFAILDMYNLFQPEGLLARLKQRGYSVKEP